ncbi:MAG: hypothetical protein H6817_11510 [Phycisphaerales bacterium]|nr:hypothetical protein [Phycisphaerales bacterium]
MIARRTLEYEGYDMETQGVGNSTGTSGTGAAADPTQGLGGDEFFKLLIAQLVNQDPLEPTSNQELLNQISSIRDIELSTNLSESLQSLTSQQRFTSAASLIGQFITSTNEDGNTVSGIVQSIRFENDGSAILEMEDGGEVRLDEVGSVMHGERAAEALIGKYVTGLDTTDPSNPETSEGIVTGVSLSESGRIMLDLDSGKQLRLTDVLSAEDADAVDAAAGAAGA